tara:strand:+ start:1107 stop:2165 length:1059 start_codon:yes stop_codon:yes gene_type:complete
MALQSSGSITARDIAIELGYTQGAETKIGDYRLNGGQDFTGVKLPVSEGVPTSGEIKFSDFYDGRRTLVVDYHSGSPESFPENAKDRFTSRSKVVVGGFVGNDNDTSGKKVVIVVNKDISSSKGSVNNCALKTGTGWSSNTVLEVLLGSNGELLGAGGDGGNGGASTSGSGGNGGAGSSGLGIQHEGTGGTRVTIESGGRIAAGGGGGGGGGGAFVEREERWGGPRRYATGAGGGGGAGVPAGNAGGDPNGATAGSKTSGGSGGAQNTQSGGDFGATGGAGGAGGNPSVAGSSGANGFGFGRIEGSPRHSGGGGSGGSAGAAIRRNSGFTVVIQNLGPPSQLVGSTSATGIA